MKLIPCHCLRSSIFRYFFIISTLLLGPSTLFGQPLNGIYSIGGFSPDYTTISAAVSDLNSKGISGAVTFNISPGTYNEQVIISSITGASSSSTVTFQSAGSDSSSVIIEYNTTASANYVVHLDGAHNVNFKHVSLETTGSSRQIAVLLTNGASNNKFLNNVFTGSWANANNYNALVYLDGGDIDNNLFHFNRFTNGGYQFRSEAYSSAKSDDNKLLDNLFTGSAAKAISLEYQQNITLRRNKIQGDRHSIGAAINLENCSGNIIIDKNNIAINSSTSIIAIDINETSGTASNPVLFSNNFVSVNSPLSSVCMDLFVSGHWDIINNSFALVGNSDDIFQIGGSVNNVNLRNNIFSCPAGGRFINSIFSLNNFSSNYNAFYTTGSVGFTVSATNFNLSQWQNQFSEDLNSQFANPNFISTTDLHINNAITLKHAGTFHPQIIRDIDAELRNNPPDIGADEFTIDSSSYYDIALAVVKSPKTSSCTPQDSLIVGVKNLSNFPMTSFKAKWQLFGTDQDSVSFSGSLVPGDTAWVNFGQLDFSSNTLYAFNFVVSSPNGQQDSYFNNNFLSKQYSHFGPLEIFKDESDTCTGQISLYIKNFPRSSVVWSDGSALPEIIVTSPGTYSVTVTDPKGCSQTASITIN